MKNMLVLFLLTIFVIPSAYAEVITIRADEWCPYNCEPGSDNPGFMIEIAQYAFEKAGHQVDYKTLPWARAIIDSRSGTYNAIVGAFVGDAPDFIFPENELAINTNAFFIRKGDPWRFTGLESLKTIRLGVIRDYSYGDDMDAYVEQNQNTKWVQVASGEDALVQNMRKLSGKRIDVLVEDSAVFYHELKQTKQESALFEEAGDLGREKVYIAFSPNHPRSEEYARILSDGVAELRASGKLQEILSKYGITLQE